MCLNLMISNSIYNFYDVPNLNNLNLLWYMKNPSYITKALNINIYGTMQNIIRLSTTLYAGLVKQILIFVTVGPQPDKSRRP